MSTHGGQETATSDAAAGWRCKDLVSITEAGFLFDATDGESYTLNPVGLSIVRALLDGIPSEDAWQRLVERYDVDESGARRDVIDFLARLRTLGLVVRRDGR